MKPYGSRRTYKKCIVLRAYASAARALKLTMKNRKTDRQNSRKEISEGLTFMV